ncbi:hypothetical protein J6590_003241 [Homalodisca vitripennis]|nr:hypothetical protein J6590_003241 [Homalodisca vitripennis]
MKLLHPIEETEMKKLTAVGNRRLQVTILEREICTQFIGRPVLVSRGRRFTFKARAQGDTSPCPPGPARACSLVNAGKEFGPEDKL